MKRARIFCQGHFGHFWGPGRVFFQGLGRFLKKGGGFSERGGGFICFLDLPKQRRLSNGSRCSSSCHTQTEEPLLSNSRVASVKQVVIAFIKEFLKIVFMHNATVCAQANTQFVKLFSMKLKCAVSPAETEVPNVCVSKQNKTNSLVWSPLWCFVLKKLFKVNRYPACEKPRNYCEHYNPI